MLIGRGAKRLMISASGYHIEGDIGDVLVCDPNGQWGRCNAGDDYVDMAEFFEGSERHPCQ